MVAGEGPSGLLICGLGASVVTWRDNIGPLSRAHRVYAVDLPGHGDSDKPDIDYAVDTKVRVVVRLLESLNLESTTIIGNSTGSALGLITPSRHPELVARLVLVDSVGLGREVYTYLRLVSIPGLGVLLESSRVGGTRLMLKKVFTDETFVIQELLDDMYRS